MKEIPLRDMVRQSYHEYGGDKMKKRRLGHGGLEVSAIGLGCMGMSEFYGRTDDAESRAVLFRALEEGVTFFDTAESYGHGHNEELLGNVLREWKDEVVVATKFGIVRKPGEYERRIDNSETYIRSALEASLRRLKRERVDLYYVHRLDHSIPVEQTMGVLAALVAEGKIGYVGLSEVSAETIRRAHAVHPVCAVQTEYSLFTRFAEKDILPTLNELGIGFVPYSPLGRGILSGKSDGEVIENEGDFRKMLPRFSGENYSHNMILVNKFKSEADRIGVEPSQLALAWVLHKGDGIVPIPGTKREKYLLSNIRAADLSIDENTMRVLDGIFSRGAVKGNRYPDAGMAGIEE